MSSNDGKRARKAEKKAANRLKRQQRHQAEKLEKQEAHAVVNDERDVLEPVNSDVPEGEQEQPVNKEPDMTADTIYEAPESEEEFVSDSEEYADSDTEYEAVDDGDPFADINEDDTAVQPTDESDEDVFAGRTEEELDAELGDFEQDPEPDVVPEPEPEPEEELVSEPEPDFEPVTDEEVFVEESAGKSILNRHPFEDPNADIITRSEDTGSMFREYDSGQEFQQKDDSADFEEIDDSKTFEEDTHEKDLEFVSESESVEHDAKIIEDVVEQEEEEEQPKKKKRFGFGKKKDKPVVENEAESDEEVSESEDVAVDEDVPESETQEDEKPEVIKLSRQERREQRKNDWAAVKADKAAYKLYKKAGNKGPLDRSFTPDVETKEPVNEKPEAKPVPKKRSNKRNGMSNVVRESVVEAVWPDFLENKNFIVERDGEQYGVGLFLDTATIGGFNKKSKNDESKGGILEALSSGLLKHLVTEKLMEDECIVFIPCPESMSVIDEYSILYNAEYTLCYVNSDGEVELSNFIISASDVDAILMENTSVSQWIKAHTPESEQEEQEAEEILEDIPDEPEPELETEPRSEYLEDEDDLADAYADLDMESEPDEIDYESDEDYNEDLESVADAEADEEDVVSFDVVSDTIVRTFYSDDLRLEVSTEPFDSLFIHANQFIPFQGNRVELFDKDDSFLGQAISEMVKDYNTQLEGVHYANLQKLRADYYTLVNLACTRIAERYDMDNIETEVGKIKHNIDVEYSMKLSTQEERAHQETNRIDMEWRQKLDEVGKAAAEKARATYTDRFLRAHNDDLAHVMPNIQLADETEYKTKLQELHETRRHDAAQELDKFVNEIVAKLNDKYREMADAEAEARDAWAADLRKYVDEHRKDEFARAAALAERQRQRSEADIVKADMIGSLNQIRSEFETSQTNWKNQTEAMQAKHEEELRAKDQLREQKLAEEEQEKTRLKGIIDELSHQLETLDEAKEAEYKTRVTQLENESLSWRSELDHQRAKHKRQNIVSATLAIIAILAALSVGFIGGAYVNLKADRTKAQQAIVNEMDDRLEENSLIEADE